MANFWVPLQNQPKDNTPSFNASTMILLTDGTVMCHDDATADWFKLVPHRSGDYSLGTWHPIHAMHYKRKFFASQVLKDGRVLVVGGEYSNDPNVPKGQDTPSAEVYDPDANRWTKIHHAFDWIRGDASSCMLADGRILYGALSTTQTAIYDPKPDQWVEAGTAHGTMAPSKSHTSDEESWVLLPDGTVLTASVSGDKSAEKYVPSSDRWVPAGNSKVGLAEFSEIGPAILLPDGRAWFVGASGHTAFYEPPEHASDQGKWNRGPDLMLHHHRLSVIDGPVCLRSNGKVLALAGLTHTETDSSGNKLKWSGPCTFFELDPNTNKLTPLAAADQPSTVSGDTWTKRLLLMPNGEVLFSSASPTLFMYEPPDTWDTWDRKWAPKITDFDHKTLKAGQTYTVRGTQLTGLSQAVGYGDDYTAATNYPLARIAFNDTGNLHYCKTFDFSSMGVATGKKIESFKFRVPASMKETGHGVLVFSVNGISADMIMIRVVSD